MPGMPGMPAATGMVDGERRGAGMRDRQLIGCHEKSAEKGCGGKCRGMPWNDKEEKITGTGCNHHEKMVATEKRNPVNIIFYLVKVIPQCFLDSCPHPKIPENEKNTYTSIRKRKATRNQIAGNSSCPIPSIIHNFTS